MISVQPSSRRDAAGVVVLVAGGVLVAVGIVAFWILFPLIGAALTIAVGLLLATIGVRTLLRAPK
jgi:hypothetical protein